MVEGNTRSGDITATVSTALLKVFEPEVNVRGGPFQVLTPLCRPRAHLVLTSLGRAVEIRPLALTG